MPMSIPHRTLKNRQRTEREGWPEFLSLRVHRALSWLDRAERCEDDDGCFVFLWVVNATYADEAGEHRLPEAARLQAFLGKRPKKAVIDGRDRYLIGAGRRRRPPSTALA